MVCACVGGALSGAHVSVTSFSFGNAASDDRLCAACVHFGRGLAGSLYLACPFGCALFWLCRESLEARQHRKLALNGHNLNPPDVGTSDYVASLPSSGGHSLYAVDKDEDEDELMGHNGHRDPLQHNYQSRQAPRVMLPPRGYDGRGGGNMV